MFTRRRFIFTSLALPPLSVLRPRPAEAVQHKVRIQSMQFSPATLVIKAGDSVVFENRDALEHTATAKDGSWDSGNLRKGKSATLIFDRKGEFDYICRWHGGMRGKIRVE